MADIKDSQGTPLSKYRIDVESTLNPITSMTNGPTVLIFNQLVTGAAWIALGVLSLISSSGSVLAKLTEVYDSVFTRITEYVPPVAIVTLFLIIFLVWIFFDRRANVRTLAEDSNRIILAFALAIATLIFARNPFEPFHLVLKIIPDLAMSLLTGSKTTTAGTYLMDHVMAPMTQTVMYGAPLESSCSAQWSKAMAKGGETSCAPKPKSLPNGAMFAAILLLIYFVLLALYGIVMFAMFIYFVTMAAWSWFVLIYVMAKAIADTKAIDAPSQQLRVAIGNTLCAVAASCLGVAGPALAVAVVNVFTVNDPLMATSLHIISVLALFILGRQLIGWTARKFGVTPSNWLVARVVAPPSWVGAEAKARRRRNISGVMNAAGTVAAFVPGGAAVSAGLTAGAVKMRAKSLNQAQNVAGQETEVQNMSPEEVSRIDGAASTIAIPAGAAAGQKQALRSRISALGSGGSMWGLFRSSRTTQVPAEAATGAPAGATGPGVVATQSGSSVSRVPVAMTGTGSAVSVPSGAADSDTRSGGRHAAADSNSPGSTAEPTAPGASYSAAAFSSMGAMPGAGGLGADSTPPTVASETRDVPSTRTSVPPRRDPEQVSEQAAAVRRQFFTDRQIHRGIQSVDGLPVTQHVDTGVTEEQRRVDAAVRTLNIAMARPSTAPVPRPDADAMTASFAQSEFNARAGAALRSALAGVNRTKAQYVARALGIPVVPVMSEDDPGRELVMYTDGERNVVEPARRGSMLSPRI